MAYVAERSGNSEQSVLECLCKSAPARVKIAILTRLNAQRAHYLVQAAELVAFAIDFEVSTSKKRNGGGHAEHLGHGQGGRYPSDGQVDKCGLRDGYVARVGTPDPRTCYGCGEAGHILVKCPKTKSVASSASSKVALAVSTGTCADSTSWILDSGSSVHLVKDSRMLKNAVQCDHYVSRGK